MAKLLHTIDFIRGLRASIPDFDPGFEEHEGRLVSLEIICPHPFGKTPIEFHCTEIVGEKHEALQQVTYYLSSQGARLDVGSFVRMLQENFPWMKELSISRLRILVGPEKGRHIPVIELDLESQTEDGRFVLPGSYSLEEKEREWILQEPPFDSPESLFRRWLHFSEDTFDLESFHDLQNTTRKMLKKLEKR